jgi:trimethylamine--corrinoid protein Co-methyltransferase
MVDLGEKTMADTEISARRRGGRAARQALRAAPIAEDKRPIRPGLESKDRYRLLGDNDRQRIHRAVLDVLEQVGFADPLPSTIEYLTAIGAGLTDSGRITFPRALVEDMIAKANRRFELHGRDPKHDLQPWGSKVYFGTAGAAVSMVDPRTGEYRESTVNDLYDAARLADTLDNIHFFQRTVVARDIPDPFEMDFNTCYASVSGTSKHVGTSWVEPPQMQASIDMLHAIAGGEDDWRRRPFVSISCCFVVPPFKFAQDACACLELAAREGMPVLLVSAGQAGATSPAALAGAVVQQMAEVIGGLIYVNAVIPGAPAMIAPWPFVSDLRSGAMCGGSGEQALLSSACGQMGRFYDLTTSVPAGMSDSKLPDAQSGYEKGYNHILTGNSGANLIYESGGMLASLLGFSHESLAMDNDSIGAALRSVRAIEINDETLSTEVIKDVCLDGPGHFLGSDQTIELMESEYVYPLIGDRASPKEWAEQGSTSSLDRAIAQVDATLAEHYPRHIPDSLDASLRERFPIRLARERMAPNSAWPRYEE